MNDDLRDMVSRGASTDQIRAYSRKIGMPSLRDAGLRALFDGTTTLDEVVRETVHGRRSVGRGSGRSARRSRRADGVEPREERVTAPGLASGRRERRSSQTGR